MVQNLFDIENEQASLRCEKPECDPPQPSRVLAFRQDEEGHWVAVLSCGHTQHLRHQPPWQSKPWVLNEAERLARLGQVFPCGWCKQAEES